MGVVLVHVVIMHMAHIHTVLVAFSYRNDQFSQNPLIYVSNALMDVQKACFQNITALTNTAVPDIHTAQP